MGLGRHLHELTRLRGGLLVTTAIALLVAVWAVFRISLLPPGLHPRALEMASASTSVLVDTPTSSIIDKPAGADSLQSLTDRAVLLGNVMASPPVRAYIARHTHVPVERITAGTPVTPDFPRPVTDAAHSKRTTDLVRSPDQYRLSIQVNPTVPIIDVYAQAPGRGAAIALANGAVDGLRDYLNSVARAQRIPLVNQVQVKQLGRASGGVVNGGVQFQLAIVTFLVVFGVLSAAALFVGRVRRGWNQAADAPAA